MEIIRHDNARLSIEHINSNLGDVVWAFKTSRDRLVNRFRQAQTRVKGSAPRLLTPAARNQELYFALVDFVMGTVGRLLVRTATSTHWYQQTLSVLALWATKLKVLSHDPQQYANMSLDIGEALIDSLNDKFKTNDEFLLKIRAAPSDEEGSLIVEALEYETDLSYRYYREKTYYRRHLFALVRGAIQSLHSPRDSTTPPSCFETCAFVYRTGLEGALTTLSNDRTGQISASSDPFFIKCTYTALELAYSSLRKIPAATTDLDSSPAHSTQDLLPTLTWEWTEDANGTFQHDEIDISRMEDMVSIVVPMELAATYSSMALDYLVTLALQGTDEEDPVLQFDPPPKAFQALFKLSTAEWVIRERKMSFGKYRDQDVEPVSANPMRLGIRAGSSMKKYGGGRSPTALTESRAASVTTRYQEAKFLMDRWVTAEESLTINCRSYVFAVITIAAVIVCGGMAVPFAVGTRIRGVDPFQITSFAWFIAGFITVLAKSRYVGVWPWHDFLRGQVVCRSIKDVCEVPGMDSQMVLMYLLLEERVNTLRTKGPYNGMFIRKAEGSDGFAIDKAVQLSTMLASGFVILKVLNEYGEHLICLDIRKGTRGEAPVTGQSEARLACINTGKDTEDLAIMSDRDEAQNLNKVKKLVYVQTHWFKVLGLYVRDSRFG